MSNLTKKYLGIDMGGTAIKYGIVTEEGAVLHTGEYPVAFDGYETSMGTTLRKTSRAFLEAQQIEMRALSGIGVSATGQIDVKRGYVAGAGGNIKNWIGTELKGDLETQFGLPVTVINDANCVAIGEQWVGAARNRNNVIVITVGTGVGGGIIQNGQVLLGHQGFAGELGHFSIDRNGRVCSCGNKGCYEQYASMTALIRKVKANGPFEDNPDLKEDAINGRVIFEEVAKGNKALSALVDEWIMDVVAGMISLVHIFNPELILIGGGVSKQETLFIAKVRAKVKEQVMENFGKELEIEAATLGNQAGVVGAVHYFLQHGMQE